ncbi:hypothetical protein [Microbulbifer thermotolerans]|uniref:hypothetical protein n=1 Tax=Microbulbifer thermotolerans TaxID=252514 RepID=UPI0008E2313C|nr:hypothetical protein [Microbulbifer thermotolerans]MCX2778705.1 hypothetical protein [Microbulbifer thermotolerans]MCX2803786.1 hypothetical protein [Microbulbifer thermotolerans]MCX2843003.1 hypothetical protein [Microbulbifer thermotolerans]SFC10943.1 hypothetical protein SAMN05660479_01144 [Microbulbifer thermotolerans]
MKSIQLFTVVPALLLFLFTGVAGAAEAVPTEIVVRAKAKDAKFIGTSIGGALVRIRDTDTGEILAQGLTQGGTGNTERIMKTPRNRYDRIGEGAAKFEAKLDISEPVFVTVEVLAPHIKKQARVLAQTQTWLVPGKPIGGDGLIVEIPGMVVDVLSPKTLSVTSKDQGPFEISANVVMMCGCPLTDGGLWDGSKIEVAAIVKKDGQPHQTLPLQLTDTNTFSAPLRTAESGVYEILVYAYDPKTGNTGVDRTSFVVR